MVILIYTLLKLIFGKAIVYNVLGKNKQKTKRSTVLFLIIIYRLVCVLNLY